MTWANNQRVELTVTSWLFWKSFGLMLILTVLILWPCFFLNSQVMWYYFLFILFSLYAYLVPKIITLFKHRIIGTRDYLGLKTEKMDAEIPWRSIEAVRFTGFRQFRQCMVYSTTGRYVMPVLGFDEMEIRILIGEYLDSVVLDPLAYKPSASFHQWKNDILRQVDEKKPAMKVYGNYSHIAFGITSLGLGLVGLIITQIPGLHISELATIPLFYIGLAVLELLSCFTWIQADNHFISFGSLYIRRRFDWEMLQEVQIPRLNPTFRLKGYGRSLVIPMRGNCYGKNKDLFFDLLQVKMDEMNIEPVEKMF